MNTPKAGQLVYVAHLTIKDGQAPSARVSEREFYRVCNPKWAEGETLWSVGPIGKGKFESGSAPFGIAYKPEKVHATRADAQAELNGRIDAMISKLQSLKG